ncbi:MAG TPA: ISL3 family transposase [Clostridia bacterium]|nr:ISL3 family transposase [Clostridia bacterium]
MLSMDVPECQVVSIVDAGQVVLATVAGNAVSQVCPSCGHESDNVHSRYVRKPQDLPLQGRCVQLQIIVRRWRCLNQACPRKTFGESFNGLIRRHAQRTERASTFMRHLILALSSTAGALIATVAGMKVSGRTLLRVVRDDDFQVETPRVLGVDDFALRKGHTYGTLLCDLETGKPVDVLVGRDKEPLFEWLRNHPGIEIVARDRASAYADAVRLGAPQAIQVADRFHLVKNVCDALKEVVDRQSWALAESAPLPVCVVAPEPLPEPKPTPKPQPAKKMTREQQKRAAAADRCKRRYEEVHRLYREGLSIRQIRNTTGLARATIEKYLQATQVPTYTRRKPLPSKLDPFVRYLEERWQVGCHHSPALFDEIVQQGYRGSRVLLRRLLSSWRAACPPSPPKSARKTPQPASKPVRGPTWKEVRGAVLCLPEHLSETQKQLLPEFLALHPKLALARDLIDQFRALLRDHDALALDHWLLAAAQSEMAPFERLARTLNADRAAVLAAIQLPWSTGPVEGQITRVKLIKRIGYGRASLPLLRARIIGCA